MKTVLHRNEDGYELIVGFRDAQIDPRATDSIVASEVLNLPELAQASSVKIKISAQLQVAKDNWAMAAQAEKDSQAAGVAESARASFAVRYNAYMAAYNSAVAQARLLEEELKPIAANFDSARAALWFSKAVYFTPGPGEDMISDEDFAGLSAAFESLGKGKILLMDGTVMEDNRGRTYWAKSGSTWSAKAVATLGQDIPAGAVLEADLSEAQRTEIGSQAEATRIAGLSAEEKTAELANRLQAIAQEALNRRGMAEITGEAFDAPAWYQARKAELEAKYK